MKTIDVLLEERDVVLDELAQRTGLPLERVAAIANGRWTPSPAEREKLAAALSVPVTDVSWGHTMNPRNVRYHRFGLKEDFQGGASTGP
jgi:transcriptional regulator with XRE-family HTH domain